MIEDWIVHPAAKGRRRLMLCAAVTLLVAGLGVSTGGAKSPLSAEDWPVYGGNNAGERFSKLTQITPANVGRLAEAWRVETGPGGLQTSPIMIDAYCTSARPTSASWRWMPPRVSRYGDFSRGRLDSSRLEASPIGRREASAGCSRAHRHTSTRSIRRAANRSRALARTVGSTCGKAWGAILKRWRCS